MIAASSGRICANANCSLIRLIGTAPSSSVAGLRRRETRPDLWIPLGLFSVNPAALFNPSDSAHPEFASGAALTAKERSGIRQMTTESGGLFQKFGQ